MHAENIPTVPASTLATLQAREVSYAVTVTPNDSGGAVFQFTLAGGPSVQGSLEIDVQTGEMVDLRFNLDASSGKLVSNPINWYSDQLDLGGVPIDRPQMMTVERPDTDGVMIRDDNTRSESSGHHHFTLSVLLGGKVYTSPDPTIINNPIGSVGSGRTFGQDLGKGGVRT